MVEYKVQGPDGVQHVIEGPAGASDEEVLAQAQELFSPSKLESFGRGALNNFPLAKQMVAGGESALEGSDYSKNLEDLTAKAATAKSANPKTYGAGAATGAIAPVFIPGVGEAMEAAPIASNAALGAADAVGDTDLTQNPGEIAKQAGKGALIGGVSSALLGKVGNAIKGPLNDLGDTQAVKTLGMKGLGKYSPEEVQELGAFAREHDVVKGPLTDRLAQGRGINSAYGQMIGDMGTGVKNPPIDIKPLEDAAAEWEGMAGTEANAQFKAYQDGAQNIKALGSNPTFEDVGNLKSRYGRLAFDDQHAVKNQAAADVYHLLADHQKEVIKGAPGEYQNALYGYAKSKEIVDHLEDKLGLERNGGTGGSGGMIGSQIKKLPGAVRAPLAAGMFASGHPIYGVMAGLPEVTDPAKHVAAIDAVTKNIPTVTGGISYVTTKIMTALQKNPQSLGKFAKPLAQAAQSGGNDGIAATHFILSQQHPEYNDLINGDDTSNDNSR